LVPAFGRVAARQVTTVFFSPNSGRKMQRRRSNLVLIISLITSCLPVLVCQTASKQQEFSPQERLRGEISPERAWWDVLHYDLSVEFFPKTKKLKGSNRITFKVLKANDRMQIDLQPPLKISRIMHGESKLDFEREGNVYWVHFADPLEVGTETSIDVFYGGKPVESRNPPWSGGVTWSKDENGQPFIVTTCQGIGASIWWPNKDHGYDEPDRGVTIKATVPEGLSAVANGRLISNVANEAAGTRTFCWQVNNPINNYCVNVNIGDYCNFSETYEGEFGKLDIDYWVLRDQKERAETQFKEAPRTIKAFEYWFGKYPFYEDGYKLVSVPYAGMEHQSSVTYGNGFKNGYRGRDLSDTGVGFKFDFIIVHESGHEWFGNNISMKDAADMWIHEGFTNYSENLFVEYHFTKQEAEDYVIGCRRLVRNDRPVIGTYNVNNEGSGDMYYKGGNMLHTMRHVLDDDEKWRQILRGLNSTFWHQTVDTGQIEDYINKESGIDFSPVFEQYLRSTMIPRLNFKRDGNQLSYWYDHVVHGFRMPVVVSINGTPQRITPTEQPQTLTAEQAIETFEVDRNFYVETNETTEVEK
jgi:aminopeptidase N